MAHQYMPKIFHGPHNGPPTYLMHGPIFAMIDDFTLNFYFEYFEFV